MFKLSDEEIREFQQELERPLPVFLNRELPHYRFNALHQHSQISIEEIQPCLRSIGIDPENCMKRYFANTRLGEVLEAGTDRDASSDVNGGDKEQLTQFSFLNSGLVTYAGPLLGDGAKWVNDRNALGIWHEDSLVRVPGSSHSLYAFRGYNPKSGLIAVFSIYGTEPMPVPNTASRTYGTRFWRKPSV